MNKVFYFDIDGTLLPHGNKELSTETKYALKELIRLNYTVFIATGKHQTVAQTVGNELGIKNYITTNGQQVHMNDELVYEQKFDIEEIKKIRAILEESKCTLGLQNYKSNYVLNNGNIDVDLINGCFHAVSLPTPEIHEDVIEDNILQLLIFGKGKKDVVLDEKYKMFHWHDLGGDILPVESSKANGIKQVKHLFANYTSYAFGDGDNDIEMFNVVDHSVAMGNANEKVKSNAKHVTTNDVDHGVYEFLVSNKIIKAIGK